MALVLFLYMKNSVAEILFQIKTHPFSTWLRSMLSPTIVGDQINKMSETYNSLYSANNCANNTASDLWETAFILCPDTFMIYLPWTESYFDVPDRYFIAVYWTNWRNKYFCWDEVNQEAINQEKQNLTEPGSQEFH